MRLIDADAAIEAVVGCTNCGTEDVLRAYVTKHSLENGWTGGIVDALDAIEQLPSAEPDTTTHGSNVVKKGINDGDRTSGDCISRQQAINKIKPWLEVKGYSWGELNMLRAVINELENMPSAQPETNCSEIPNNRPAADVVPVVRCKDCKDAYCRTYQNWQEPIYTCTRFRSKWNTDYDLEVNPDDFCSYGKRKE